MATKKAKKAAKAKPIAKKSVAKSAAKKSLAKVSTKPVKAALPQKLTLSIYDVQDVPEHQHFYFVNGMKVKNVKELAEVMDRLEQEVFDYHVNENRNDFHNWVKDVFNDLELAEKLLGVTGPKHLQFTIYKHVADRALKKK